MDIHLDALTVSHNAENRRFETQLGEQTAVVSYIIRSGEMIVTHTEVPYPYEGYGIAAKITQAALDYARENGLRVRPMCPYTAAYIKRHKEYQPITVGY
ncbi:MAG: N-acetyltransferase [Chloroflexi bacterium]|nr:N-acetyltransferase [Chloroflexota bacterium]MCC6897070.1 N-acetyltransferase [Anaerolineae bacterium]